MTRAWQLQDAKNRLSELVERAQSEGPQTITRRGKPVAIVVSAEDYKSSARAESLVNFLRKSPLAKAKLDLRRDPDVGRDLDL